MPVYSYDHIHLRSRDPMATAQYYQKMFDAKIVESVQTPISAWTILGSRSTIWMPRTPS